MANRQRGNRKASKELKTDPLVEALAPDPCEVPPDAQRVTGFVGKSTHDGWVRLYRSHKLNRYIEFPTDAVVQARYLSGKLTQNLVGSPTEPVPRSALAASLAKEWTEQIACTWFCTENWFFDCTKHVAEERHLTEKDNQCNEPCVLTWCPFLTNSKRCPEEGSSLGIDDR